MSPSRRPRSVRALHAAASGATDAALADDRRLTLRSQSMATLTSLVLAVIAFSALQDAPPDVCVPSEVQSDENATMTTTTTTTTTLKFDLDLDGPNLESQSQQPTRPQTPSQLSPPSPPSPPFMTFNTWFVAQSIVQLTTSVFFGAMTIALSMLLCIKQRGGAPPLPPGKRSSIVRYSEVRGSTSPARYSMAHRTGARHRFTAGLEVAGASHLLQATAVHTRDWWTPAGAIGHVDGNPGHSPCRFIHVPKLSNIIFEFADGATDSGKSLAGIDRSAAFQLAPCGHVVAVSGSQTLWLKAIRFHTSFGRISPMYGAQLLFATLSQKSGAFRVKAPGGKEIWSLARVGVFSAPIAAVVETEVMEPMPPLDIVDTEGVRVTSVEVRQSPEALEAVIFTYSDGSREVIGDEGAGYLREPFDLEDGEHIVSVVGRQDLSLRAVQFVTSRRRVSKMYGDVDEGDLFYQHAVVGRQVWSVIRAEGPRGWPIAAAVEAFVPLGPSPPKPPTPPSPPAPPDPEPENPDLKMSMLARVLRKVVASLIVILSLLYLLGRIWIIVGIVVAFTNDAHKYDSGDGETQEEANDNARCVGAKIHFWINMAATILNYALCMRNTAPGIAPPPPEDADDPEEEKTGFNLMKGNPVAV